MSLVFKTLNEETVMLPVLKTTFKEMNLGSKVWVEAWCNGQYFELDTTLNEIIRMANQGQVLHQSPSEFKNLRGFSGV